MALLGDRGFVGALVAVVVGPRDDDLVAGLAASEPERQERVLRHRRAHSADSTVRPLCVAVTFWMNHAGIVWPFASLRWPLSISWLMRTFTSTLSPAIAARIFIGSAMFSPSA